MAWDSGAWSLMPMNCWRIRIGKRVNLKTLTRALNAQGHDVLECLLLDMYSDGPICETHYADDSSPFAVCPWFDPDFRPIRGSVDHDDHCLEITTYVGSARRKVFGVDAFLSKIGLIRYRPEMLLTRGQHGIFGGYPSEIRGVMFHFKYFSNFPRDVERVMLQGERSNCSAEWRAYKKAFDLNPRLSLHDQRSVKLIDSRATFRDGRDENLRIVRTIHCWKDELMSLPDIVFVTSEDDRYLVKGGIGTAVGILVKTIGNYQPLRRIDWITESPTAESFIEVEGSIRRHYVSRDYDAERQLLSEFATRVSLYLRNLIELRRSEYGAIPIIVEAADWEGLAADYFSAAR